MKLAPHLHRPLPAPRSLAPPHSAPLPLNLNPQLTWRNDPRPGMSDQATRAASLAHAALRFHLTLQAGLLEPEVYHLQPALSRHAGFQTALRLACPRSLAIFPMYALQAYPLDMSQYGRLFASTRLPQRGRDALRTAPTPQRHIVVAAPCGALYRVEVLEGPGAGALVSPAALQARLRHVLAHAAAAGAAAPPPVGALTAGERDTWAAQRAALEAASGVNVASLAAVDDALFVLTLDGGAPESQEDISRCMLHGGCGNRWFDKCLNLIVAAKGRAGVSWEHAWGDGVAVLNFFNAVFDAASGADAAALVGGSGAGASGEGASGVAPLQWQLDGAAQGAIAAAHARARAATSATRLRVYQTDALTKDDIKRSGLSPDGVMQMALQLAHWRVHSGGGGAAARLPVTYESASTAAFRHGRTETIRSATVEALELCQASSAVSGSGGSGSRAALLPLLKRAAERHRALTLEAVQGGGCDRHLFALSLLAGRRGVLGVGEAAAPPPAPLPLFADPAYAHFRDIRLSTSTMASPALDGGGFGPVNAHSYAVGYGVEERGCHFHIMCEAPGVAASNSAHSAFAGELDVDAFAEGVEGALRDIAGAMGRKEGAAALGKGFGK